MRSLAQRLSCFALDDLKVCGIARSQRVLLQPFTGPSCATASRWPTHVRYASQWTIADLSKRRSSLITELNRIHSRAFASSRHRSKEEWPKVSITEPDISQPSKDEPPVAQPDSVKAEASATVGEAKSEAVSADTPPLGSPVQPARQEDLPSHIESQRTRIVQWFNGLMDEWVPRLVLASQKINRFTGTDYSGIEGLRREIQDQEQLVRARHVKVTEAKEAFDAAHAQRADSQKEVVGLLERKHSWAASDLERYMSLIRSEHLNDQAVQAAKDAVSTAEKALEEARSRLEKRERAQYHEEQIWSDTIRRNSTWVTFVLMGFNILLLLVNVVVLEPWRRRKIVREIKSALDDKAVLSATPVEVSTQPDVLTEEVHRVDGLFAEVSDLLEVKAVEEDHTKAAALTDDGQVEVSNPVVEEPVLKPVLNSSRADFRIWISWANEVLTAFVGKVRAYFDEDLVTIRRVDITAHTLEGAAAGAALMGMLFALLRPH